MECLKRRILREGRLQQGRFLSLDHFLTHRIDIDLMQQIGVEFHRRFGDCQINKILTIESFRHQRGLFDGGAVRGAGAGGQKEPPSGKLSGGLFPLQS